MRSRSASGQIAISYPLSRSSTRTQFFGRLRYAYKDGKPVPPPERKPFRKAFGRVADNENPDLFSKPVKVGESWDFSFASFAKSMGVSPDQVDQKASFARGKLLRVFEEGGATMGEAAFTFKIVLTGFPGMSKASGVVNFEFKKIVCFKGDRFDRTMNGTMTMDLDCAIENQGQSYPFKMTNKQESTESLVSKGP